MALVASNLPADASSPVDRAFASIYPQNVATTGSVLALDLNADPSAGPPTHLTWTVGGGSGGLYSGAVAARPGTLDIRYIPTHRSPGGFTSGHAVLVFRGTLLVTGVGNIVGTGL